MGDNVDIALEVLPEAFELWKEVLPGYDPQVATGIFGDVLDRFVLCRPQFEMDADKIVQQLTLMVPDRAGGDREEDPHYGVFAATYLTEAWLHKFGLKSYHFVVSDAPARDRLDERYLVKIFGEQVWEKVAENGHQISSSDLPTTKEVYSDLLKISHAFFLQIRVASDTREFWSRVLSKDRVIEVPDTYLLPHVQAAIMGLTEGTLDLQSVQDFLLGSNVQRAYARQITESVSRIPLCAQSSLPAYADLPKAGALFKDRLDIHPIDPDELESIGTADEVSDGPDDESGPEWL